MNYDFDEELLLWHCTTEGEINMSKKKRNVNKNKPVAYSYGEFVFVGKDDYEKEARERALVVGRALKLMPFLNRNALNNTLEELNHKSITKTGEFMDWDAMLNYFNDELFKSAICMVYNPNSKGVYTYSV